VTFTATVSAGSVLSTPGGTVTFSDGSTTLATVPLDASLHATFSTSLLTAGTHPVIATFNGDTIFDATSSATLNVVVGQSSLIITADNRTKILDAPNPSFTVSYSGFVLGDGPGVLGGVLSCTTTAVTTSPVGSYPITCSGQTSSNYTITYVPGTLSIIFAPGGLCDGEPGHAILSPIATDGSTVVNVNRTVPAKFRVCDVNGVSMGTPGTISSFRIIQTISGTGSAIVDLPVDSRTADTQFRWDPTAQQWIFNINTSGLTPGLTYVFRIGLADGSNIDFRFGTR
jgi:hypothetical protein